MEINEKYIGKNLKEIRERRGMTRKEMSQFLSMSYNYYCTIERGIDTPSLYKLIGICALLNITPNYLLANAVTDKDIPDGFESGFIRYRAASYRREHNLTMAEMGKILKMSEKEYESFEISAHPITRAQTLSIEFLIVRQERKQAAANKQASANKQTATA